MIKSSMQLCLVRMCSYDQVKYAIVFGAHVFVSDWAQHSEQMLDALHSNVSSLP